MLTFKIQDKNGDTKMVSHGEREVGLVSTTCYEEGDTIVLELAEKSAYVWVSVDESLGSSMLYMTGNMYFHVPFGDKRISYSPKAFSGTRHYMFARYATEEEIRQYRNLAVNVNDQHENDSFFPHASANVETRGEAVFAARNAIDGIVENHAHGEWPYASWGINRRDDACIRIDFGRTVLVDKIVVYERADFPHDNWWKQITVAFSDESEMVCDLIKTDQGQEIKFAQKEIEWLELKNLIKSEEPSPFPALSQLMVFGTEIN